MFLTLKGHVQKYRGDQMKLNSEEMNKRIFNADVFTGEEAIKYG